ncbi:hypothetical protein LCGC14_1813930, partial [marine sediment metagenome]
MLKRLLRPLWNNRGQINLNTAFQTVGTLKNLFDQFTSNTTTTGLPRGVEQLGGAAALIASLRDQPTVEIPEFGSFASPAGAASTGFLQSIFESPTDPFATGGLFESQSTLLAEQEKRVLDDIQQRFIAGLPQSLSSAQGGQEIGAIRDVAVRQLIPRRQALIAELSSQNIDRQIKAAQSLAELERIGQFAGFQATLEGATRSAEAERERNNRLAQLGIA